MEISLQLSVRYFLRVEEAVTEMSYAGLELLCRTQLTPIFRRLCSDFHSSNVRSFMVNMLCPLINEADTVSQKLMDTLLAYIVSPKKGLHKVCAPSINDREMSGTHCLGLLNARSNMSTQSGLSQFIFHRRWLRSCPVEYSRTQKTFCDLIFKPSSTTTSCLGRRAAQY